MKNKMLFALVVAAFPLGYANASCVLYDGPNYTGQNLVMPQGGIPDLRKYGFNNKVSSVKLKPDAAGHTPRLTLFQNTFYEGTSWTKTSSGNLGSSANDQASSAYCAI